MNKKISEKLLDVIEERVRAQVMYQNLKGLRMEDIHNDIVREPPASQP